MRIEVPELFGLLVRCFLEFVDFLINFESEFLKIDSKLIPQICVTSRLRSDCFHLLEERIFVVGKRPVPEDRVAVTSLDLLDGDEVFGCEILLEEAQVALEGGISG